MGEVKMARCWEKEDRCEDCPANDPDNKCSEYMKPKKSGEEE